MDSSPSVTHPILQALSRKAMCRDELRQGLPLMIPSASRLVGNPPVVATALSISGSPNLGNLNPSVVRMAVQPLVALSAWKRSGCGLSVTFGVMQIVPYAATTESVGLAFRSLFACRADGSELTSNRSDRSLEPPCITAITYTRLQPLRTPAHIRYLPNFTFMRIAPHPGFSLAAERKDVLSMFSD